jgi:hypothetical protein
MGGCSEEVVERGAKQGRTRRRNKQENVADEDIKNNEHHPSFISPQPFSPKRCPLFVGIADRNFLVHDIKRLLNLADPNSAPLCRRGFTLSCRQSKDWLG